MSGAKDIDAAEAQHMPGGPFSKSSQDAAARREQEREEAASPADSMTLPERLRALADHTEAGAKANIAQMPAFELMTTMKMTEDLRAAADELDRYDQLIADCIGAEPVREEAQELKGYRERSNAPPPGPSLDWIKEAGS